jgi:hypothetical protein
MYNKNHMISKVLLASTAAFFLGALPAYAQTTAPTPVYEVIATVNIEHATVTAQKGSTFTIDFDLTNRVGVQPDVHYGVSLVRISGGAITTFDEHVYDETLVLGANASVHRTVTYSAPENFSGQYSLMLLSKSSSGIPFATVIVGKVTLQGRTDIVSVDPTSCFLTVSGDKNSTHYPLIQKVAVGASEKLFAHCTVRNNMKEEVTLAPQVVQRLRSAYGDIVPNGNATVTNTVIAAQTSKDVTIEMPPVTIPQTYAVTLALRNVGTMQETNHIAFRYALTGAGASIRTLLLDKAAYSKGDTAVVSFMWSPLVDTLVNGMYTMSTPLSSPLATFSIVNGDNVSCGDSVTQPLTPGDHLLKVSIPISADCQNPKVSADIKDSTHGALDAQTFSVVSPVTSSPFLTSILTFLTQNYIAIAAIILLMLLLAILYKRRISSVPMVMLLVAFSFAGGAQTAHADTVTLLFASQMYPIPEATDIFIEGYLSNSGGTLTNSFAPNAPISFVVVASGDDNTQYPSGVNLFARGSVNGGSYSGDLFPDLYAPDKVLVGVTGGPLFIGNAPSTPGSYNVSTQYGADGYAGKQSIIPFTVTAPPPPAVNIYFQ